MATSSATELKVLINILSSGTALQTLLNQTNQLSKALAGLQAQANAPAGGGGPTASANAITASANAAVQGIQGMATAGRAAVPQLQSLEKTINSVWNAVKFLSGGFLALKSVQFLKGLADEAARTEVLGTVLHVVAHNAGVSATEIDRISRNVQKLGITAQAASQSLTQMLQAGLDVKFAAPLARASQDLAVISGLDSSRTFSKLVTNIQQLDTLGLRWMGIVVSMQEATTKYATAHGKMANSLSQSEKQQALLNEVLVKSAELQGTYEAAMGDVGKQLTSLVRLFDNLSTSLGKKLLPAYSAIVAEFSVFLDQMNDVVESGNAARGATDLFTESLRTAVHWLLQIVLELYRQRDALLIVGAAWLAYKAKVLWIPELALGLKALYGAFIALTEAAVGYIAVATGLSTGGAGLLLVAFIAALTYTGLLAYDAFKKLTQGTMGLEEATRRLTDARSAQEKARVAYQEAILTGNYDEEKAALAVWEASKKQTAELAKQVELQRSIVRLTDPKRFFVLEEQERRNKFQAELNKALTAADTAAAKLRVTVTGMEVVPKDTADKIGELENLTTAYQKLEEQIKRAAERTKPLFKDLAASHLSSADFRAAAAHQTSEEKANTEHLQTEFNRRIEAAKEVPTRTMSAYRVLLPQLNALEAEVRAGGSKLVADPERTLRELATKRQNALVEAQAGERELYRIGESQRQALFKEQEAHLSTHLQTELDMLKARNEQQAEVDKQLFDRGEEGVRTYYANRIQAASDVADRELQIAVNNVSAIEREQKKQFDQNATVEAQAALRERLEKAQAELQRLTGRPNVVGPLEPGEVAPSARELAIRKIRIELENALYDKTKQTTALELQNLAYFGGEDEALGVINNKYADRLRIAKAAVAEAKTEEASAEAKRDLDAIDLERRIDLFKFSLAYQDKSRALEADAISQRNEALALDQAILDVEKQRIAAAESTGAISSTEAMRMRNVVIQQQVDHDREELSIKELERDLKRQELAQKTKQIQEALATPELGGFDPNSVMTQNLVLEGTKKLRTEISGLTVDITKLHGAVDTGVAATESYNKTLTESFINTFSTGLTTALTDFENFGKGMENIAQSITNQVVGIFIKAFTERLFKRLGLFNFVDALMNKVFGGGGGGTIPTPVFGYGVLAAEGGPVVGPGTGTSDSIPAMVSAGEHIMPASKAAQWMPLLEGIRLGTILPYALGGMVGLQSIAIPSIIPRRYASGGVVVSDGGASSVQTGGGVGNMIVSLHPDSLNMTMREWLEHEVIRQQGRR